MSAPAPAATQQHQRQKLYRTLHDQIDLALYPQALRTVNKLLTRDPDDQLALATRAQLVVALDRYPEALQLESANPLTMAYCLYKLARPHDAAEALNAANKEAAHADPEQQRARQVLEAQLSYRLGEYERARDLFDELAATAELDSPELADLEVNLAACTAQLDFLAAVPANLANLSGSGSGSRAVPSVDELEARPLALVLPSTSAASTFATVGRRGQTGKAAAASSSGGGTTATPRARRRPRGKRFAATAQSGGAESHLPAVVNAAEAPPAEDRWIPKRQRPSMRDALLQAKEKQRGRKRDKVMAAAAATQGSAAVEDDLSRGGQKAGGGGGGGKAGSGSGNKKKKGGRK